MGVGVGVSNTDGGADSGPEAAVCARVRALLESAPLTPEYRAALGAALALPGNALAATPNMRWARPVWTCCTVAGGAWRQAVPVAAALEVFMVALDLLDDEEDAEENPVHVALGSPCALNVSTGLLLLAQREFSAAGVAAVVCDAGLRACGGQHADLTPPTEHGVGLDDALRVTAGKSASLMAVACRLGALVAGADARVQALHERFGGYVGMAAQLTNDMAALQPDARGKTDAALGRPTLPLAYATIPTHPKGLSAGAGDPRTAQWTDGPLQFTWVVAETYRRYALELTPRMARDDAGGRALAALLRDL